jgi:predicted metalloprotease
MIVALWVSVRNLIPTQVLHPSENVSPADHVGGLSRVLAHENWTYVQKLLGTDGEVQAVRQQNRQEANQLSVRLELPADCFAGVWGHSTQQHNILEAGDVDAGLKAAAAAGDDRLQRMSRGSVNPESFTHVSFAQRMECFQRGFQDGTIASCNTFQ